MTHNIQNTFLRLEDSALLEMKSKCMMQRMYGIFHLGLAFTHFNFTFSNSLEQGFIFGEAYDKTRMIKGSNILKVYAAIAIKYNILIKSGLVGIRIICQWVIIISPIGLSH
eukprot:snap_masked-scaffold_16-processed-gene-3.33-mRNA-1 protein AED:1.00 eAED:1.00 QI:0/-1/0/0/-1/1/1/0/110